jgi:endoglucanase/cellulose 1,4-beta-cellobiosidase
MPGARVLGVSRYLALFAAIVLLAAIWLTIGTGTRAGAAPPAPAPAPGAAPADTPAPPLPTGSATPTPPSTSPFPPSVPGDLRVTAVTSSSITLAWTASRPGCCAVAGYDVTFIQAFNDVVLMQNVGDVTTYTFGSTIRPATEYTFRVSARDHLGHRSASSNPVTVVTPLSDSGPDTTPPSAPGSLTLTGVTPAGAGLTWSGSTDDVGVTGYNVYRFDGLHVSTLLATVAGTSYTAPLASSSRNIFYVRARDAAGNVSIASNTAIVTSTPTATASPPIPPPACRVSYANSSQWAGGFVADLKVTNTAQTPVTGWTVTFQFGGDQRLAAVWNAGFSQTGTAVTLTNVSWNRVIPAGGSASVGLLGRWTASNAAPTAISLNGSLCAVG